MSDNRTIRIYTGDELKHKDFTWPAKPEGNPCRLLWYNSLSVVLEPNTPGQLSSLWVNAEKIGTFDFTLPPSPNELLLYDDTSDYGKGLLGGITLFELYAGESQLNDGFTFARGAQLCKKYSLPISIHEKPPS